jgi:hypothetical protein
MNQNELLDKLDNKTLNGEEGFELLLLTMEEMETTGDMDKYKALQNRLKQMRDYFAENKSNFTYTPSIQNNDKIDLIMSKRKQWESSIALFKRLTDKP